MTDKLKCSPGEWYIPEAPHDTEIYERFEEDDRKLSLIAEVAGPEGMERELATLFRHAPNLYRELEDAADRLEELAGDNIIPESVQGALRRRAARYRRTLAKARGEE